MTDQKTVGYVGTGLMGGPMAGRLIEAGFKVTVWNRSPEKTSRLKKAGADVAASPRRVADAAGTVMMCLTDTAAVAEVVFGKNGLASGKIKLIIDNSSIRPDKTREFAARLNDQTGVGWVDAPVSGGVAGAEAGTLAIMAGGSEEDIATARALSENLCARFTHMGDVGAGQVAKLCNQLIVTSTIAAIAECVNFAKRSGVDAAQLAEAFAGGFADSKPLQIMLPRMANHIFEPKIGAASTLIKDVTTIEDVAQKTGARLDVVKAAGVVLRQAEELGFAEDDIAKLILAYED